MFEVDQSIGNRKTLMMLVWFRYTYHSSRNVTSQQVAGSLRASDTSHIVRIMSLVSEYTFSRDSMLLPQTLQDAFSGWCKFYFPNIC